MKYLNHISFIILIFLFASGVFAQEVTGTISGATVSRGSTVKGVIKLEIPEGLHVNSNKPVSEYAIPTTVKISGAGIKLGGVSYPGGTNRKFQFSESELNVYEGDVEILFTLFLPRAFRGDKLTVKALVQYQACTEEVCYPPKETTVTMTAAVK